MHLRLQIISVIAFLFTSCMHNADARKQELTIEQDSLVNAAPTPPLANNSEFKTIHVFVALCDNQYQGIVPVNAKIGNGQDPANNLYWGCAYGIKSYFKNSKEWQVVQSTKIDSVILERVVFKHKTKKYYLIADAYNGKEIKKCTIDYLNACAGNFSCVVNEKNTTLFAGKDADVLAYIGHDGLMDFKLDQAFTNADGVSRKAIVLACISKKYFAPYLSSTKAQPLLWTTGLMAPEAYILHKALSAYLNDGNSSRVQSSAAAAYNKFQKCGIKAASRLLVGGW
jgi:hypothetical protein